MPTGKLRLSPKMWRYSSAGPETPTSSRKPRNRYRSSRCWCVRMCAALATPWESNEKLDAVVLSAAAWLVSNPTRLPHDLGAGVFTHSVRGAFPRPRGIGRVEPVQATRHVGVHKTADTEHPTELW